MTHEENIPEWPHKPAPPEPKRLLPEREMLWRGLGLAAVAAVAFGGIPKVLGRFGLAAAPLAVLLGAMGVLAAWAAAIHLTGGERFDDHPWV